MKIIILGIDGLSHSIIEKCKDSMPNLYRHLHEDTAGVLTTTFPYFTGPAWTSFQTGKDTSNHGVNNYYKYDKDFKLRLVTSNDIKEKTFYEALDENGLKCFIMNLPYTSPAKIEGDLIYSWLYPAREIKEIFHPESLLIRYPTLQSYKNGTDRSRGVMRYLQSTYECLLSEEAVIKEVILANNHDVSFFLLCALDRLQHKTYDMLMNDVKNKKTELSCKILRKLDDVISWVDRNKDPETVVMIASDHGFRVYEGKFFVNSWLKNRKLLVTATNGQVIEEYANKEKSGRKKLNLTKLITFVKKSPWLFGLAEKTYDVVVKRLPFDIRKQPGLDLKNTKAYCRSSFECTIFINEEIVGSEREKLKKEILVGLNSLEGIDAFDCDDFYKGKFRKQMGEIVVTSKRFEIDCSIGETEFITMKRLMHDLEGTFVCYGPGIRLGKILDKAHITDMTPTILHMCGVEVPADMDGKVLKEIFEEGSMGAKDVRFAKVDVQGQEKEKLRGVIEGIEV